MKKLPTLILMACLAGSVAAAPPAPGIEMAQGNSITSLELIFQAGNTPVAGFDVQISFSNATVAPNCQSSIDYATVHCVVAVNLLRILVEAPYVQNIPLIENQHLATVDFEFTSNKSAVFIIEEEHYFDALGNVIEARKGKKRWRSKKP